MRLLHYSDAKVESAHSSTQLPTADYKPQGFWVSVKGKDDWKSWCESEGFRTEKLTVANEVTLAPNANILYLRSERELWEFTAKYKAELYPAQDIRYGGIDWAAVAKTYQGIIIAPYIWDCRFLMWYYPWDCASGCIWDAAAIESIAAKEE